MHYQLVLCIYDFMILFYTLRIFIDFMIDCLRLFDYGLYDIRRLLRSIVYFHSKFIYYWYLLIYGMIKSISCNSIYSLHFSIYSFNIALCILIFILIYWLFNWDVLIRIIYYIIRLLIIILSSILLYYILLFINDIILESYLLITILELLLFISGILYLIFSELLLFISCFWSIINFRIISIGFSILISLPLLVIFNYTFSLSNIYILVFSSIPLQIIHVFIKLGFIILCIEGLSGIISCGYLFMILQFYEFIYSYFSLSDLFYGSIYYFTTGLHGIHVIFGLLCFWFIYWLFYYINRNPLFFLEYSLNIELSSYYWHFVDLIWLFVFLLYIN